MAHWRFTNTPSGDRAVILGARLATWDQVEQDQPHDAALALHRIEVNGLDVFTESHPFWGRAIPWLTTEDPAQPGLYPPQLELCPPVVVQPPVTGGGGPSVVPEPATAALFGVGLLVMVWACRKWGGTR